MIEIPDAPDFVDDESPPAAKRSRTKTPVSMGRCWMVTIQPWTSGPTDFTDLLMLTPRVCFAAFQLEVAPTTGQQHLQCYIEFSTRVRMATIKALGGPFATAHLEKRIGTQKQAIAYCCKEESRAPGFGFHTCDLR